MFPYFNIQPIFMQMPSNIQYYDQSIEQTNLAFLSSYYNMINPDLYQTSILYQNALNLDETNLMKNQCDEETVISNFDYLE